MNNSTVNKGYDFVSDAYAQHYSSTTNAISFTKNDYYYASTYNYNKALEYLNTIFNTTRHSDFLCSYDMEKYNILNKFKFI